jgi:putative transcriptional regulator
MQRLRLKADGRIVELRNGREFPLAPSIPFAAPATSSLAPGTTSVAPGTTSVAPGTTSVALAKTTVALATTTVALEMATSPVVRDLRRRARLTQQEFAARLGVPVETIRNWEQGKRMPRGPARALLAVIAHAPETVFAALARA